MTDTGLLEGLGTGKNLLIYYGKLSHSIRQLHGQTNTTRQTRNLYSEPYLSTTTNPISKIEIADDKNHWTTTHFLSRDRHTPCDHWTYDLLAVASTKGSMKSWKRCFNFELGPKSQNHVLTPRQASAEVNGRARGTTSTFSGSSAHAQHRLSERQPFQPYNI